MAIDVILGADALAPPLTGIGRYSYELARQLRRHPEVSRLRYLSLGRWVPDPIDALVSMQQASVEKRVRGSVAKPPMLSRVRSALAANRVAVRVYQSVIPPLARWHLRREAQAVFHSPNYLVPQFPGQAVNTVHDLSHILYPQFHPQARVDFMNLAFEESLKHTSHVITDTETVRQEFIGQFGWSADQVSAIGLGVDAAFHPRSGSALALALKKYGLEQGQYSLYVGTLEPRKNVGRLLQAYGQLDADLRCACPLVVVGGRGWKSDEFHRQMELAAGQGWLHYLCYVDQLDLPMLYAGARLFAYPSLYEGFGLPIVEAMASAAPVLTSNTSCMPEVAGGAAKLVNPWDVEGMREALAECLEDESWQAMARKQGLARAAMFSWNRCANETVAVYQQVIR